MQASVNTAASQRVAWRRAAPASARPHMQRAHATACHAAKRHEAVQQLLELAAAAGDRGESVTPQLKAKAVELAQALRQQVKMQQANTSDLKLSGTWKMVWTTEQETLFIVKNASWFGTKAGEIYQVIDVSKKQLQNVITFPPEGCFVVDSSINVEDAERVSFKFNSATLKLPAGKSWNLPPFGQGWFDNLYVDDEIRIAYDIRGDVLLVKRDGPPRTF